MKMRCNIFVFLFIVTFFFSCSENDEYADIIVSNLQEINVRLEDYNYVVIIPDTGCGGCISEAERFFKENANGRFFFIFTKVYSLKELHLRHGEILQGKNVLIDLNQKYASLNDEVNIYPIIVDVRNIDKPIWTYLEPGISYQEALMGL